ncbi:hypothetical protein NKR19_g3424 [Coniochaeta hoffmannii]|uniref:Uncharacterized protein n=1 Tax=Coniochaeta hoffmannii TaxID=91930 RepID=A0AA38RX04_9PEZI|nr:hypothetical protein NKR19_g3424 [Coniochaeta hoffmannii]
MAILIALVQQQLLQQPSGGRVSDDRKGICKVNMVALGGKRLDILNLYAADVAGFGADITGGPLKIAFERSVITSHVNMMIPN